MNTDEEEEALIEEILDSAAFSGSVQPGRILRFLFERARAQQAITRKDIILHLGAPYKEDDAIGKAMSNLRERLARFQHSEAGARHKWICSIRPGKGHRLVFEALIAAQTSKTELFWRAHCEASRPPSVVCNTLLFFYNAAENSVIRFFDTNVSDPDGELELAELKKRHKDVPSNNLQPVRFYMAAGEMYAYDHLQQWFNGKKQLGLTWQVSRDMKQREFLASSPILLGTTRTNKFIAHVMRAKEATHFAYRFHEQFGSVVIVKPTSNERSVLRAHNLTEDGVLKPSPGWQTVYGVVSRLQHPAGIGAVTVISSDFSTLAMGKIAEALTNEGPTERLMQRMKWERPLPKSFEMLFAVRLSPGDLKDEAGDAELLCWRPH